MFVLRSPAAGIGMVHQVMIGPAFEHENNEGGPKRDLRFIRNTSGGENDDGRDEVEEVVIDQGCNQRFKKSLLSRQKIFFRQQRKTYMKAGSRSRETVLFKKLYYSSRFCARFKDLAVDKKISLR